MKIVEHGKRNWWADKIVKCEQCDSRLLVENSDRPWRHFDNMIGRFTEMHAVNCANCDAPVSIGKKPTP